MAYTTNDIIDADEYNTFVNSTSDPYGYNAFAGTSGSGAYGLGQTNIATVSEGTTISAAQWNSLFNAIAAIADHTGDTLNVASEANVSDSDLIAVKANLVADIATLAASVAAGCPNTTLHTSGGTDLTSTATPAYDQSHVAQQSFTFDSAEAARYFFNAGGQVRMSMTNAGGTTHGKNTVITDLMSQMGTFSLSASSSSVSGTTSDSTTGSDLTIGFYDLTTSYQTVFLLTESTSTYSSSYNTQLSLKVEAKCDVLDNTGGTATVVTLQGTVDGDDGVTTNAWNAAQENVGPTSILASTRDVVDTYLSTVYNNVVVAEVSNTRNNAN